MVGMAFEDTGDFPCIETGARTPQCAIPSFVRGFLKIYLIHHKDKNRNFANSNHGGIFVSSIAHKMCSQLFICRLIMQMQYTPQHI